MTRLTVPLGTVTYVQYSKDAKELVTTGAGMTFVRDKEITVTFHGPVISNDTDKSFEYACYVTLDRVNGRRLWYVSLGTPIDSYEEDHDVPEEEIPEVIRRAVNTFIEAFEK